MSGQNYTTAFKVDQAPEEVFDAINNVRGWWTGAIEGSTDELGAEFTYQYENLHKSTQKITELVPGKKVVWHVTEAEINFVEDKSEWKGTDIVFDIAEKDGKTEVRFTHVGLVPAIECYDSCSDAWGYYVKSSLREFIANGKA
ncbi:MAG: ATPase [Actinobacteria bacterium 13_1_20CM_3_71_11]|nr:MAG: ATPase [Actinobacteria bacterium 13_1_20CM_3_71_11]TML23681.1 MAG: SRPBCC domain-containing protein [Actinomycetota bacterium]